MISNLWFTMCRKLHERLNLRRGAHQNESKFLWRVRLDRKPVRKLHVGICYPVKFLFPFLTSAFAIRQNERKKHRSHSSKR